MFIHSYSSFHSISNHSEHGEYMTVIADIHHCRQYRRYCEIMPVSGMSI